MESRERREPPSRHQGASPAGGPLPDRGGAVIELARARRERGERLLERRMKELMLYGGYSLFDALRKAVRDLGKYL